MREHDDEQAMDSLTNSRRLTDEQLVFTLGHIVIAKAKVKRVATRTLNPMTPQLRAVLKDFPRPVAIGGADIHLVDDGKTLRLPSSLSRGVFGLYLSPVDGRNGLVGELAEWLGLTFALAFACGAIVSGTG